MEKANKQVITINPNKISAWNNIALLYEERIQRPAEALYCYERAANLRHPNASNEVIKLQERGIEPRVPTDSNRIK